VLGFRRNSSWRGTTPWAAAAFSGGFGREWRRWTGLAGAGRQGDMGDFTDAVAGLRADLADNPLTKGVMSSDQALRGYKAAMDAALGRGSQALTEWIEGFR
jgi:hypothetical protein